MIRLWVTENVSYLVKRINIANGAATTLLNLSALKNFSSGDGGRWPQGGLMGLALHPDLYSGDAETRAARSWIYLAYVFSRPTGQTCSTNSGSSNILLVLDEDRSLYLCRQHTFFTSNYSGFHTGKQ
jgi:hypothetical protein